MNHEEALRRSAVEKYLLNELPEPERDDFEEHFFDCTECAADLKTTAAFLDGARKELRRSPAPDPAPVPASASRPARPPKSLKKPWFDFLLRPAFAGPAFAAMLGIILYQNVAVFPRSGEVPRGDAQAGRPEILTSLSLIGANGRGGGVPTAVLAKGQPLLISLDIPGDGRFPGYTCVLVASSGAVVWRLPVSEDQAKDTVAIRVPSTQLQPGEYRLIVQGNGHTEEEPPLATYRFVLT